MSCGVTSDGAVYNESTPKQVRLITAQEFFLVSICNSSPSDCTVQIDKRRGQLKCDGTRAKTRFRLSAKRTSPFKSAGASIHSTTGSRGVRISGSNAGYIMLQGSVKGTGYPLHSPVSPSLPLPCVTVCHHISTEVYPSMVFPPCRRFIQPGVGPCVHQKSGKPFRRHPRCRQGHP